MSVPIRAHSMPISAWSGFGVSFISAWVSVTLIHWLRNWYLRDVRMGATVQIPTLFLLTRRSGVLAAFVQADPKHPLVP